ncbi:MAG: hypothetical protein OXF84_04855 [Bacteroidetes bacterium]|nr:hypothetical protein [Bacteroidota bacterium]
MVIQCRGLSSLTGVVQDEVIDASLQDVPEKYREAPLFVIIL